MTAQDEPAATITTEGIAVPAEWTWPDGALLMNVKYGNPSLVKVAHAADVGVDFYGTYFISNPELGEPSGGSSWCSKPDAYREPSSPAELHTLHVYQSAARVKALKAELADAERDLAAVKLYGRILNADADR